MAMTASEFAALELAYQMLHKIAAGGSFPAREYFENLLKMDEAMKPYICSTCGCYTPERDKNEECMMCAVATRRGPRREYDGPGEHCLI